MQRPSIVAVNIMPVLDIDFLGCEEPLLLGRSTWPGREILGCLRRGKNYLFARPARGPSGRQSGRVQAHLCSALDLVGILKLTGGLPNCLPFKKIIPHP